MNFNDILPTPVLKFRWTLTFCPLAPDWPGLPEEPASPWNE